MSSVPDLILLAVGLGAITSGLMNWYLVATRPYRKVRNVLAIGFGYVLFIGIPIGSLLVLRRALDAVGVAPHSSEREKAVFGYAIGLVPVVVLGLQGELKWRKAAGLDHASVSARRSKPN